MPIELAEARILQRLCQTWNYSPEEARKAPAWVLRATSLLLMEDEYRPKETD